ncbi:hypothetical protein ACB435_004093 [Enterobacter hormaechei]
MMNYLTDLDFIDIYDLKENNAFFWGVSNPLDYKCGERNAKQFVHFLEKYPFMNKSNVLYRIACDMSDSGLIKSESARGFFNTLDTLLTPKTSEVTKARSRVSRTVNDVACDMGITSIKLLNFLALVGWIDNATVQPNKEAIEEGVLRRNSKSPFGFIFTNTGERLIRGKYEVMNE